MKPRKYLPDGAPAQIDPLPRNLNGSQLNTWRAITFVALSIMDLSWMTPWLIFFAGDQRGVAPLRIFLILGVITVGGVFLTQLLRLRFVPEGWKRWIFAAYLILIALFGVKMLAYPSEPVSLLGVLPRIVRAFNESISIPFELAAAGFSLWLASRGTLRASRGIGPYAVFSGFRLGAVCLLGLGFIEAITGLTRLDQNSVLRIYLLTFLFAWLVAMGSARIAILSQLRGGQKAPVDRRRLSGIVAFALILVGCSVLLASLVGSPPVFALTINALLGAIRLVLTIIAFLLSPLLVLVFSVLTRIFSRLAVQPDEEGLTDFAHRMEEMRHRLEEPFLVFDIHINLMPYLYWGLLLLLLAALLYIWRSRIWKSRQGDQAELDSLLSQGDLSRYLRRLAQSRIQAAAESLAALLGWGQAGRRRAAARIRQIYAELLEMSAKLGDPRRENQTPGEYLLRLVIVLPGLSTELEVITAAYQRVRYGEIPETSAEVEAVESAWRSVAAEGERKLKYKRKAIRKN